MLHFTCGPCLTATPMMSHRWATAGDDVLLWFRSVTQLCWTPQPGRVSLKTKCLGSAGVRCTRSSQRRENADTHPGLWWLLMEALLRRGVCSKSRQQLLIWFTPTIKEQPDAFGGGEGEGGDDKASFCVQTHWAAGASLYCHILHLFTPELWIQQHSRLYCDLIKEPEVETLHLIKNRENAAD